MAPEHNIRIDGTLKPRSKFLGNSAASMMEGIAVMRFLNTGERLYVIRLGLIPKMLILIASSRNPTFTCAAFSLAQ
jgi:hypothetical protein